MVEFRSRLGENHISGFADSQRVLDQGGHWHITFNDSKCIAMYATEALLERDGWVILVPLESHSQAFTVHGSVRAWTCFDKPCSIESVDNDTVNSWKG